MKYFIVSDIHSYLTCLLTALKEKGYNKDNPNHCLIICGDLFDRGDKSVELYNWVRSIPKERRVLIRGNHEYLLRDLLNKKHPEEHDFSNGTVRTCCAFAGVIYERFHISWDWGIEGEDPTVVWKKIRKNKQLEEVVDWIFNSGEWVNYFELNNYIFVHSFIPLTNNSGRSIYGMYHPGLYLNYNKDWRVTATDLDWVEATWGCPYQLYKEGFFQEKNKTLVVGHWRTCDFFLSLHDCNTLTQDGMDLLRDTCPIFRSKRLIGIDACTAHTHRVNVLTYTPRSTKKE